MHRGLHICSGWGSDRIPFLVIPVTGVVATWKTIFEYILTTQCFQIKVRFCERGLGPVWNIEGLNRFKIIIRGFCEPEEVKFKVRSLIVVYYTSIGWFRNKSVHCKTVSEFHCLICLSIDLSGCLRISLSMCVSLSFPLDTPSSPPASSTATPALGSLGWSTFYTGWRSCPGRRGRKGRPNWGVTCQTSPSSSRPPPAPSWTSIISRWQSLHDGTFFYNHIALC